MTALISLQIFLPMYKSYLRDIHGFHFILLASSVIVSIVSSNLYISFYFFKFHSADGVCCVNYVCFSFLSFNKFKRFVGTVNSI